jgi:hypothetical protein
MRDKIKAKIAWIRAHSKVYKFLADILQNYVPIGRKLNEVLYKDYLGLLDRANETPFAFLKEGGYLNDKMMVLSLLNIEPDIAASISKRLTSDIDVANVLAKKKPLNVVLYMDDEFLLASRKNWTREEGLSFNKEMADMKDSKAHINDIALLTAKYYCLSFNRMNVEFEQEQLKLAVPKVPEQLSRASLFAMFALLETAAPKPPAAENKKSKFKI